MESNKICFGNLLLFVSQYMLIPVLPAAVAGSLDISFTQTGFVFIIITAGMFIAGPLYAYLADTFKRKYVCVLAYFMVLAATVGYLFVPGRAELYLLALLQGAALGIATATAVILAIDISPSDQRSKCNLRLGWAVRAGMILGVALGVLIYSCFDFTTTLYVSVGIGLVGVFGILIVRVPFRAPIGVKVLSLDRFLLLPQGILPAVCMILIAFVPGLLFPLFHLYSYDVVVGGVAIPFFGWVLAGVILSIPAGKLLPGHESRRWKIIAGVLLLIVSMCRIWPDNVVAETVNALLMGIGLGLITPGYLRIFIGLSKHCQRSTANTTHLLAWQVGSSLGIVTGCYFQDAGSYTSVYALGVVSAILALVFSVVLLRICFNKS